MKYADFWKRLSGSKAWEELLGGAVKRTWEELSKEEMAVVISAASSEWKRTRMKDWPKGRTGETDRLATRIGLEVLFVDERSEIKGTVIIENKTESKKVWTGGLQINALVEVLKEPSGGMLILQREVFWANEAQRVIGAGFAQENLGGHVMREKLKDLFSEEKIEEWQAEAERETLEMEMAKNEGGAEGKGKRL